MGQSPHVWLADLTYTQQTISSDIMPAAIGGIATYTKRHLGDSAVIRIFKFPEKLAAALERGPVPQVIGFSNYAWNRDLSAKFARVINTHHPRVVTVIGGRSTPHPYTAA